MSIDIDWERATCGPDGEVLAERIRSFIHDKFQQVALPRFIRSVQATAFDFGTISPDLEIRDLCDPFPDFYEEDEDGEFSDSSEDPSSHSGTSNDPRNSIETWQTDPGGIGEGRGSMDFQHSLQTPALRSPINFGDPLNAPLFPRSGTPGIPGGTSNLGYYYMPLGGLSGTQTPLGAAARNNNLPVGTRRRRSSALRDRDEYGQPKRLSEIEIDPGQSRPSTSDTLAASLSSAGGEDLHNNEIPRHPSHRTTRHHDDEHDHDHDHDPNNLASSMSTLPPQRMRERKPEDFQVFCRVKYGGNIKLSLTAEILLDYPMPSFVGLPLKLNITGLTFDGVAIVAYIRRRVHFCFLSPEDADTLLGADAGDDAGHESRPHSRKDHTAAGTSSSMPSSLRRKKSSLLRDIRVESEIGRKENGKQVLKNVGKVEKFVLEQVRRIFEEEFVYPSFWTFLV